MNETWSKLNMDITNGKKFLDAILSVGPHNLVFFVGTRHCKHHLAVVGVVLVWAPNRDAVNDTAFC